jgi:N-acetylmuramoyl-L-alanine amidase
LSIDIARSGRELRAPDALVRLAVFLYRLAVPETVREREAIAAAIANACELRCRREQISPGDPRRSDVLDECVLEAGGSTAPRTPAPEDALFASCMRIARRAMAGALQDPTRGSVRFHELGSRPAWAVGHNPSAWIGSFLFYGEVDEQSSVAGSDAQPTCTTEMPSAYHRRRRPTGALSGCGRLSA